MGLANTFIYNWKADYIFDLNFLFQTRNVVLERKHLLYILHFYLLIFIWVRESNIL